MYKENWQSNVLGVSQWGRKEARPVSHRPFGRRSEPPWAQRLSDVLTRTSDGRAEEESASEALLTLFIDLLSRCAFFFSFFR
jgi:hypothetical protein